MSISGSSKELKALVIVFFGIALGFTLVASIGSTVESSLPVNDTSSYAGVTDGGTILSSSTIGLGGICALLLIAIGAKAFGFNFNFGGDKNN